MGRLAGVRVVPAGRRQRNRTARERRRLLERYGSSGLSQRRFCQRHDLPLSTLTYRLRQARGRERSTAASGIVELPSGLGGGISAGVGLSDSHGAVNILLPNGLEVRAGSDVDVRWMGTLLRELHACFG